MMRKNLYLFLLVNFFLILPFQSFAQDNPVVVELFTSQGCSSCPPADRLISSIEDEYGDDVIILSYHVDYWNYIGWNDPFSSKRFTQKQYQFASSINSSSVYTPQAVINQRVHFTGSNSQKMKNALRIKADNTAGTSIAIVKARRDDATISLQLDYDRLPSNAMITYAVTVAEKTTKVSRGENRNRELVNTNIVADFLTTSAPQPSKNIELNLPDWVGTDDKLEVIVYAQTPSKGIVYATQEAI